ncbi:GDSL-type esterase/lipase family protein [Sphingomonas bacterium]|uniref:GDSL-type esterase/lipase family protein n=1 Tax=Sphingomonas bacterium TaxID=1895847 RepID=UPI0015768CE0|nr:GDSL-type esterase/lipase family protein [Sphingomonas bacterium]
MIGRRLARISRKIARRSFAWASAAAAGTVRPRIVFIGDSITEYWSGEDPWLFRPVRINAGIAGQTTAQMRLRFAADVVAARPRTVHIMGGTNDLWFGEPGEGASASIANIVAMTAMARAAGIAVIVAPPPPIGRAAEPLFAHSELAAPLRAAIADHATAERLVHVDYADSLMRDGDLVPAFTTDGVHLTRAGYRAMRAQAEAAIAAAR